MKLFLQSASMFALVAASSSAMALTKVQTTSASYTFTRGGTYGPFSFPSEILAFSASEGVLQAVDVSWTTSLVSDVFGNYIYDEPVDLFGATTNDVLALGNVSLSRRSGAFGLMGTLGPYVAGGFHTSGTVSGSATDLAPFVGTGAVSPATWTSTAQTVGLNLLLPGGGITGTATGEVTVTYTYAPVPEPASMAALSIGALAMLRRRKRA